MVLTRTAEDRNVRREAHKHTHVCMYISVFRVCGYAAVCVHIRSRAESWQSMSSAVYPWSQVAVHAGKAEVEGSRLQDQAGLHTKFKASFNYIADCLKNRQKCTLGNLQA